KTKYIHFALVHVTIKPLTMQDLNTSILVCLRDARHLNFGDSLIGAIETSLCNGLVYFDGYPDLTISLTDTNVLETLKININVDIYVSIQVLMITYLYLTKFFLCKIR
ncbi:MP domain-containing protein, partial [Cephalotus follicularis]